MTSSLAGMDKPGERRAEVLASAALDGDPDARRDALVGLSQLDGTQWLRLDESVRGAGRWWYPGGWHVSTEADRWRAAMADPGALDLTVVVGSMVADGRIRERAVRLLADRRGPVVAAALALRTLDHVPVVRAAARDALVSALAGPATPDDAVRALGVVLAGGGRVRGRDAVAAVLTVATRTTTNSDLVEHALRSPDRIVRRWAADVACRSGLLTPERLLTLVRAEADHVVLLTYADHYLATADRAQVGALLDAPRVVVRVRAFDVAVADLTDEHVLTLTTDAAARIRERARGQAARRGLDLSAWTLARLATDPPPRMHAACLETLAGTGEPRHVDVLRAALGSAEPRVRGAAVSGLGVLADRDAVIAIARPAMLDPSPRVTAAAARALARVFAGPAVTDEAWSSPQPWSRRAAWAVSRSSGGWHRLEGSLRAALDPDPALAARGTQDVAAWLDAYGARMWLDLAPEQRGRIADLLDRAPLGAQRTRVAAFVGVPVSSSVPAERRWWRWWG